MNEAILNTLNRTTGGKARLCELGKVKIGGLGEARPSRSGGTYRVPKKEDHFTITTMHRTSQGDLIADKALMEQLVEQYGDADKKLRRIPIRVLSNDVDDILQASWCWYGGKACGARSDGETVTWNNDPRSGKKLDQPIVEPWKDEFLNYVDSKGNKLFKLHSILNFVIAAKESRWGGVYKFRTTSRISFGQLHGSLVHLHQLTGGILIGMPLMLVVRPIPVAPDGKPTTVYVVHVELVGGEMAEVHKIAMEQARFQLEFKSQMQQTQRQLRALLPAPGEESDHEAEDISGEFHPEAAVPEAAPEHDPIIDGEIEPDVADATDYIDPGDIDTDQQDASGSAAEDPTPPQPAGGVSLPDPCDFSWIVDYAAMKTGLSLIEVKKAFKLNLSKPWEKLSRDVQQKVFDDINAGTFIPAATEQPQG